MEETNDYDLKTKDEEKEIGREDRDPITIVIFCRKAMGIYDFQWIVE